MWLALSSMLMKKGKGKKKVEEKLSNKLIGVNDSISCANNAKNVVNVQYCVSYIFETMSHWNSTNLSVIKRKKKR